MRDTPPRARRSLCRLFFAVSSVSRPNRRIWVPWSKLQCKHGDSTRRCRALFAVVAIAALAAKFRMNPVVPAPVLVPPFRDLAGGCTPTTSSRLCLPVEHALRDDHTPLLHDHQLILWPEYQHAASPFVPSSRNAAEAVSNESRAELNVGC